MTVPIILAYVLILSYFVIERSLRKGAKALSMEAGEFDRSSSKMLLISGLLSIILALLAPILNRNQFGYWNIGYGCWIGITLMVAGLVLRYWAAVTLGEFYTRTLQIIEGQKVIVKAPYNVIRHLGYAGIFLIEIGAGLAFSNWIVLLAVIILAMRSRIYRIQAEEEMLETSLKEQYQVYQKKTWRLIPFVY